MSERTILAMGGGGFTMEPENPALDRHALSLAAAPEPRVCLLPTASGDPEDQITRFHRVFGELACRPSHLSLFRLGQQPMPLREHLLAQDVIYVGGGSMVNLLAIWRGHGLDAILREAWVRGIVLAGLSAGSMCWFQWGISRSVGVPAPVPGLGLLPGSNSVHHDGEPERAAAYLAAVAAGTMPAGYAADDGVGLHFRGSELAEVVSSRPGARAYRVRREGDRAVAEAIEPRLLSHRERPRPPAPVAIEELRRLRAQRAREPRGGLRRSHGRD